MMALWVHYACPNGRSGRFVFHKLYILIPAIQMSVTAYHEFNMGIVKKVFSTVACPMNVFVANYD